MRSSSIILLTLATLCAGAVADESWTQFRGANAQGRSSARGLPLDLANPANIRWRTEVHGRAWSSPVVLGDQVWLSTAAPDGKELWALCVDRDSGRIIHNLKLFDVANPQYAHPFNTYASPTPAIEPGRVYITFGAPGTACVDTATGRIIWTRTDFECNHFRGAGSSPVIFEDLLLMHFDGSDHQFVVALDKHTGRTVWRTQRSVDFQDLNPEGKPRLDGDLRKGFSTPVIATVDGRPQMISLGSMACYGYDPRTGEEIWRVEYRGCHSGSPTPVLGEGMVYVCMGLPRGELWAIRLGGRGVITDTHVAWKVTRDIPTRSSPVLVDGNIYMVGDDGQVSCIDAATGRHLWRHRLRGQFSSSPIYADGRIYLFAENGQITVFEHGPQYKALSESRIAEGFMASPAVAGGAVYLRSRTALYRIEAGP
jgi:outer membrane protein assembly factor BamB